MKINVYEYLFIIAVCVVASLYSQGLFSQVKTVDGVDDDGREYVEKIIGNIYPADQAEMDSMMETITKHASLADSKKQEIFSQDDEAGNKTIYIEVSCKDATTTNNFIDFLKTINAKMILKKHRCKNGDLTGRDNYPCVEKPLDIYQKERE